MKSAFLLRYFSYVLKLKRRCQRLESACSSDEKKRTHTETLSTGQQFFVSCIVIKKAKTLSNWLLFRRKLTIVVKLNASMRNACVKWWLCGVSLICRLLRVFLAIASELFEIQLLIDFGQAKTVNYFSWLLCICEIVLWLMDCVEQ